MEKELLLVDDEPNILASLTRVFRREGCVIHHTTSPKEALTLLGQHNIGVIISDQRMPEMIGSDFLAQAKKIKPDTIRIILSGYTELNSVTDAINTGAVFKFLTKPWDDDLLRQHVSEAFAQYQLRAENDRLTGALKQINAKLSEANDELELRISERTEELRTNLNALRVEQEILDNLPIGVIGLAEDGLVITANQLAVQLLGGVFPIACDASEVLPMALIPDPLSLDDLRHTRLGNTDLQVRFARLGNASTGKGWIVILMPENATSETH